MLLCKEMPSFYAICPKGVFLSRSQGGAILHSGPPIFLFALLFSWAFAIHFSALSCGHCDILFLEWLRRQLIINFQCIFFFILLVHHWLLCLKQLLKLAVAPDSNKTSLYTVTLQQLLLNAHSCWSCDICLPHFYLFLLLNHYDITRCFQNRVHWEFKLW